MNAFRKALPWLVIALTASYLLSKLITTSVPGPMDLTAFSRIAVSADGRIQPVDSMARNTLLTISKKTTFKNVWLRPQQVKDYGGLARALYEGRAGGSGQKPVASHLWALMAQEQRDTIQTAATAIELSPQMKHDLVETINQVLDSDMRWLAAMRESLRAEGDRKVNFAPFYDAKTWTGVEVSAEEQVLLKGFAAYRAAVESKAEIKPFYSRPEEVDVNRKLLSRAFSDFVSAEKGVYDPAIVWLTDVIADQGKAESHRVFRIEHDRVLELMGLPPRPGNFRYAIDEFREKMGTLDKEVEALRNVNSKEFDAFQKALADLRSDLVNYMMFSQWRKPYWVPPTKAGDEWRTFHQVAQEQQARGGTVSQEAEMLAGILQAYARGDVNSFNKGVESYHKQQETLLKGDFARSQFELRFNQIDIFGSVSVLFVFAFLFVAFSWLMWHNQDWSRSLRLSALGMLGVLTIAYTWGLGARMYLMDRPFVFVTNLYGSAIFIGWGVLVTVLILEWFTRLGIGSAVACVIGACTAIVALHLREIEGDTLAQMQAVLDTNFWLATHVTIVTLGYAATYLAGALAIAYIFAGMFSNALKKEDPGLASGLASAAVGAVAGAGAGAAVRAAAQRSREGKPPRKPQTIGKVLTGMIYGVICFATLFSFVGTVLGGIWADQSWGRFWGWDPKENGALMIVIWNALILHARWGGMIKARGLATLAVFGNIVTTWSWFGTNQLGAGLHSYGFMDSAVFWIVVFVSSQLVIMAVSLVPLRYWRSFSKPDDDGGDVSGALPSAG